MTDLNKRQKFVIARRQGCTVEEAADKAGYSGRESEQARRLGEVVDETSGTNNLAVKRREMKQELAFHRYQALRYKRRLEAIEVLIEEQEADQ